MALSHRLLHILCPIQQLKGLIETSGFIISVIPSISPAGSLGISWLNDSLPKKFFSESSCCLTSLGLFALSFIQATGSISLFLLILPPGYGGGIALRNVILRTYFGRHILGKLLGIVMGISVFSGVVAQTITGWIFERTGSYFSVRMTLSMVIGSASW